MSTAETPEEDAPEATFLGSLGKAGLGFLALGATVATGLVGGIAWLTGLSGGERPPPAAAEHYYQALAEADYPHPFVGRWIARGDDPFVIVILPQAENNEGGDRFEGHSDLRVWRGWSEGEGLQLFYLPRAGEMNAQIPFAVRDQIDGELEWRLDLTLASEDPYDRRLNAVWERGEVEWDESGDNGRIIGPGEPLEFELVYDPVLIIDQDGPIIVTAESASAVGDDDGPPPPLSAVLQDQRFFVSVFMPWREYEQVGEQLTVTIRGTESGASETLTLRAATAGLFGAPVRYTHQFAISLGICGGDRPRYKPAALSRRWFEDLEGDGDCIDFNGAQRGELVELAYGDAAFRFYWFPTWVQAAVSAQMEEVARLKIVLEGLEESAPDRAARNHVRRKLQMIENYTALMQSDVLTDLHRIAVGEVYLGGAMSPAAFRIPRDLSLPFPTGGLLYFTDDDFRRLASSTTRLISDSESTVWADVLVMFGAENPGTRAAEGVRAMRHIRWTPIFTGQPELERTEETETVDVRSDEKTLVYAAVRATSSRMIDEVARDYYEGVTYALYDSVVNTAPFVANVYTLVSGQDHFGRRVDHLERWLSAVGLGSEMLLASAVYLDAAGHASGRVGRRMAETHLIAQESRGLRPLPLQVQARARTPSRTTVSRVCSSPCRVTNTPGAGRPPGLPATVSLEVLENTVAVRINAAPDNLIRVEPAAAPPPARRTVRLAPGPAPPAAAIGDLPTPTEAAQRAYGITARAEVIGGQAGQAFFLPPAQYMDDVVAANYVIWRQRGQLINDVQGAQRIRLILEDAVNAGDLPAPRAAGFGVAEPFPKGLVDRYLAQHGIEIGVADPIHNRTLTAQHIHRALEGGWTVKAHLDLGPQGGKRVVVVDRVVMSADGLIPVSVEFFDPVNLTLVEVDASDFNRLIDRTLPHGNVRAVRVGDPRAPPLMAPAPARLAQAAPAPQFSSAPAPGVIYQSIDKETLQPRIVRVGERLGQGATSEAYAVAGQPDRVMRINLDRAANPDQLKLLENNARIDGFGRSAVTDPRVDSRFIRVVERHDHWYTTDGYLVEIVERSPDDWHALRQRFNNRMTVGQTLAFEAGHRALNAAGYAWGDNHAGNFTFEPLSGGADRWRLVVIDPGGIMPARGATQAERAANARVIQGVVNNPGTSQFERLSQAHFNPQLNVNVNQALSELFEQNQVFPRIDTEAWGIQGNFPFTIRTVLESPHLRDFHAMSAAEFAAQYTTYYGGG